MFTDILHLVKQEFALQNALEMTAAIHESDKWSTFPGYRWTGHYCASRMREYGLDAVELMEIPADGESKIGDWIMPLSWDVEDASLEVIEPSAGAHLLASYRQEPASLAMWSAPTPPDGLEAEVVFLEDGGREEDYVGVDVRGKIVFTPKHAGRVRGPAARHGALGVISDYPSRRDEDLAEGVAWVNAWVDYRGWGLLKTDTPIFGFSLTREKGEHLRRLLASGQRVLVRAKVRSWLYDGSFTLPTGLIRGETDEEVLVYAHSYEYGAKDNAAGCALVLESARILNKLIQEGSLARPKRSVRFMMCWECYGSIAWCVERILGKQNVVAGLCLDIIGAKKALTHSYIAVIHNPYCQASITDFAATEVAAACFAGTPYQVQPTSGGGDQTIFHDPMFDVPMPLLREPPSRFHHTSLDNMSMIDPVDLEREGLFTATFLYLLAGADADTTAWMTEGTRKLWGQRMADAQDNGVAAIEETSNAEELASAWERERRRLDTLAMVATSAVQSARRFGSDQGTIEGEVRRLERGHTEAAEALWEAVRRQAEAKSWPLPSRERRPAEGDRALVPDRLVSGLLTLCDLPPEAQQEIERAAQGANPMWSAVLVHALYWADGRRSLAEIQDLIDVEFGPTKIDLVPYFQFLQDHDYIHWRSDS